MSLHKPLEFAKLCGVNSAYISVNKKRGKIILSGEFYNDSIEPNASFVKNCLELKKTKAQNKGAEVDIIVDEHAKVFTGANKKLTNIKQDLTETVSWNIANQKKLLDMEGVKLSNKLLEEKLNKILQTTIPLDLVSNAGASCFRNVFVQVKDILEKRLTRWSNVLSPEQITDERKQTLKEINIAINEAIAENHNSINEIILLSSNKKEVGERN